jgi:hypothetical protein
MTANLINPSFNPTALALVVLVVGQSAAHEWLGSKDERPEQKRGIQVMTTTQSSGNFNVSFSGGESVSKVPQMEHPGERQGRSAEMVSPGRLVWPGIFELN